ncbi:C-type lectin domain family 10 member A-like [Rhynchocyon petersi]
MGPSTPMQYEHLQNSDEKGKQRFKIGPQSLQSFLQRLFSGTHLYLFSLGFSFLLLVVICVIISQISKLHWDLLTLKTTFNNFTSTTSTEIQTLNSHGGNLKEMITSLRAEVEKHKQELQAVRSLNDKVLTLEDKLDKQVKELQSGHSDMLQRAQQLAKGLASLTCQLTALKNNGSQKTCCLPNWIEHEGTCYLFSRSKKSWYEAEKYCQLSDAHLVVINSDEEQYFVKDRMGFSEHWIGLNDLSGDWKWVDGTDYETNFKNWAPEQPDNWYGHGKGGGEDCAHLKSSGKWNDNVCLTPFNWICEASLE